VGIVPGYGWIGPYFPGFAYDDGYDDSSAAPDNSAQGYDVEAQPDQGLNQDPDQQGPPSQFLPAPQAAQPGPSGEEAVTLIFKNGRPPEQIYNYILTPTMLFVGGQHHQAIPTDQLDLAATARVNQDAGVDFQLPNALK